ncbi:reverse transcriptase domain-containing protein [Tanacetum coccineum]
MSPVAVETPNADRSVCNTANKEEAIPRISPQAQQLRRLCETSVKGAKRQEQRRRDARELKRSYVTCSIESQRENKQKYRRHERVNSSDELLERSARLWFDELPPESVDSFKDMRKKFLAYYLQQKRYTRDPVELHHVKQREGESTEAFMERYTSESLMFKGAPELMRISGFIHGITHPGLIKRLNDNIPKTVDEMMSVTKAFIRREKAAANQSKRKGQPWKQPNFQKPHLFE